MQNSATDQKCRTQVIMNLPGKAHSEVVQRVETLATRDSRQTHLSLLALQADSSKILFSFSVLSTKRPEDNQESTVPGTEKDGAKPRPNWVVKIFIHD